MKPLFTLLLIALSVFRVNAQNPYSTESLSLLFIGDIMGHYAQIDAAYDSTKASFDFDKMFAKISPILKSADFAIGNLEVTLAGAPYSGYPRFSSPDELALAAHKSGIDVLLTANNHSCDHDLKGIKRTIQSLDSMKIKHTGTFYNQQHRDSSNLLILERGTIKVGILNYTESTNGRKIPSPSIVNRTDTLQIKKDILKAQNQSLDKLAVYLHWGVEYSSEPSKKQKSLADFLFKHGVDIIIGSHPHVIQPMEMILPQAGEKEKFIAYSLGNFISDQRTRKRDGGVMVELTISKTGNKSVISDYTYHLTWVNKPIVKGRRSYEVIAGRIAESQSFKGLTEFSKNKMKIFLKDSRALLDSTSHTVNEKFVVISN